MSERLNWWTVKSSEGPGGSESGSVNWQAESQARNDKRHHEDKHGGDAVVVGPQPERPDPEAVLDEYRESDSDDSEDTDP